MMILFLDVEEQKISLYKEDGIANIPFQNAGQLYDHVGDNNILYITNAIQTNAQEVISMVKSMGVAIQEDIPVDTGVKYLHAPSEQTLFIHEHLVFKGKYDAKFVDEDMLKEIRDSKLLQQLIKTKKIEVINAFQRKKLKEEYDGIEDTKLGSIIIDSSVADFQDGSGKAVAHSDATTIDLMSGGSAVEGASVNTMSELMEEMEGLE